MSNKNCELLLEYLRSILFDHDIQPLDLDKLDKDYLALGRGMQFLQSVVEEMLEYSAELSKGNLSAKQPNKDNFLCTNLKNMNATLNHLTWQAQQVASGDYSQKVSYLGDFSEAFNTMTSQLKDREETLLKETKEIKEQSETMSVYNELFIEMTSNRDEWIVVVDCETRDTVYCNKAGTINSGFSRSQCKHCMQCNRYRDEVFAWDGDTYKVWEFHSEGKLYFQIHSYPVNWREKKAYVHVVSDITKQRLEKKNLSNKAYLDPVTSINNRLFFDEYMKKIIRDKKTVTLGYLDLDGLKYVNDNYGHSEGDNYILTFADFIRQNFRRDDIFARIGGDEFCIVIEGCKSDFVSQKLEKIRQQLIEQNTREYPVSFSYGVYEIDGNTDNITLDDIINAADYKMYKYKKENKMERKL